MDKYLLYHTSLTSLICFKIFSSQNVLPKILLRHSPCQVQESLCYCFNEYVLKFHVSSNCFWQVYKSTSKYLADLTVMLLIRQIGFHILCFVIQFDRWIQKLINICLDQRFGFNGVLQTKFQCGCFSFCQFLT